MKAKKEKSADAQSTIEKIKSVARSEFTTNGYSGTKTRDIAEKAGVNLALMNYHFRSKENLFDLVMQESIEKLFSFIIPTLNDLQTSLEEKLSLLSEQYISLIIREPNLPIFVLNEIHHNPERFASHIKFNTEIMGSHYLVQLKEADPSGEPVQHLITYLGILLFPFFMRPVMTANGQVGNNQFLAAMLQRQKMAPVWMKAILGISIPW